MKQYRAVKLFDETSEDLDVSIQAILEARKTEAEQAELQGFEEPEVETAEEETETEEIETEG
jgi:hypothetical protein